MIYSHVVCVIVTYNRLQLLKECLDAVIKQSYPIERILVVDNHSTDGTEEFLCNLRKEYAELSYIRTQSNIGGSGGFSEGIKCAVSYNPDWIWIMDDDTIPKVDALENLMKYTEDVNLGFLCSKVIWMDGTMHKMNEPHFINGTFHERDRCCRENISNVNSASFVSLLIPVAIPCTVGLPYKEFFIWADDAEYTQRICKNGYRGLFVADSVVIHKTPTNYVSTLETIPVYAAWKLFYGERNESFMRRKRKGWLCFFFSQLNCFRLHARKICKRKDLDRNGRKLLIKKSMLGLWKGFWFNPCIEYIQPKQ